MASLESVPYTCPNCQHVSRILAAATEARCPNCGDVRRFFTCVGCGKVVKLKGSGRWVCPYCGTANVASVPAALAASAGPTTSLSTPPAEIVGPGVATPSPSRSITPRQKRIGAIVVVILVLIGIGALTQRGKGGGGGGSTNCIDATAAARDSQAGSDALSRAEVAVNAGDVQGAISAVQDAADAMNRVARDTAADANLSGAASSAAAQYGGAALNIQRGNFEAARLGLESANEAVNRATTLLAQTTIPRC